jgi:predicted DNA binding protein
VATVIDFTSPAAEFPLGSVFEALPEATVELERLVPYDKHVVPYFWVRGAAATDIEGAFGDHPGLTSVRLVDSVESEYLMRATWDREYVGVLTALSETHVAVLSGVGTSDGWQFEVRGESRERVSAFRSYCTDNDIPITITAVHALVPIQDEEYGLTEAQREALVLAYETGYFSSPREVTLAEVAAELDITQQSLSSRLRRGHRQLVGATLAQQ